MADDEQFAVEKKSTWDEGEGEIDSSQARLAELGYKQELRRNLSVLESFAIGMAAQALLSSTIFTYGVPFSNGGPSVVVWAWFITAIFTYGVAACLSEIASSFPTAGSLYFWAAALAGPTYGPLAAWITGYLEFLGIIIGASIFSVSSAQFLQVFAVMVTNGGYFMDNYVLVGLAIGLLFFATLISLLPIKILAQVHWICCFFNYGGGLMLIIVLPSVAVKFQSASYVFTYWNTGFANEGLDSNVYIFLAGMLLAQFSFVGFDAIAHMAEETRQSDRTGPISMMLTIFSFSIIGWALLITLTFCIQDPNNIYFNPDTITGGYFPAIQIIWDVFYGRYGSGTGAEIITFLIFIANFLDIIPFVMCASRIAFAMARDGALPFSFLLTQVNSWKVPANATLFSCVVGILFILPLLKNLTLFYNFSALNVAAWVGGFAVPIFFKALQKESEFKPGPFYLPNFMGHTLSWILRWISFVWLIFYIVVLLIPTYYPITIDNFNYAPVGMGICFIFFLGWWFIDARHWFAGPVVQFVKNQVLEDAEM